MYGEDDGRSHEAGEARGKLLTAREESFALERRVETLEKQLSAANARADKAEASCREEESAHLLIYTQCRAAEQSLAEIRKMHVSNIAYLETKCRQYSDELAEVRRDAERYKWLRTDAIGRAKIASKMVLDNADIYLDREIDAAIEAAQGGK